MSVIHLSSKLLKKISVNPGLYRAFKNSISYSFVTDLAANFGWQWLLSIQNDMHEEKSSSYEQEFSIMSKIFAQ